MNKKIKHYTSSVFIFRKNDDKWKMLLVHHKKFDRWMIPGGHVEEIENPMEAALREVQEETSLSVRLVSFTHHEIQGSDSQWLLPPEYFFEQVIPAREKNGVTEEEHFHLDCAYIAFSEEGDIAHSESESHDIGWFGRDDIEKHTSMFYSTQKMAMIIFDKLDSANKPEDITTYIMS